MAFNIPKEIKQKYNQKPLIVPCYASRRQEFYSIDDLKEFYDLRYYLGEANDHEAYITEDGIEFIKEAFGMENLANLLYEEGWYKEEYESPEQILEFLKWWEGESKNYKFEQ